MDILSITEAISTISTAISDWIGCDWTHEDDEDEICEGGEAETCSTCAEGDEDAARAGELGEEALVALERGDLEGAWHLVKEASELEMKWGDNPAWGEAIAIFEASGFED